MNILVLITRLAQIIASIVVDDIQTARKIKALFELDPDFKVSIKNLEGAAIEADDALDKAILEWRVRVGIPVPPDIARTAPDATS